MERELSRSTKRPCFLILAFVSFLLSFMPPLAFYSIKNYVKIQWDEGGCIVDFSNEDLIEIIDIIQSIETEFMDLCSDESFNGSIGKKCKRELHNLKGVLGMFGLNTQMSFIHEIEDLLGHSPQIGIKRKAMDYFLMRVEDLELSITKGVPFHYLIEGGTENYLDQFTESLEKSIKSDFFDDNFKLEFNQTIDPFILKRENERLLELKKKKENHIMYIGQCPKFVEHFKQQYLNFSDYKSFEDMYSHFQDFKSLKIVIIDSTKFNDYNPFLFQLSLFRIFPKVHFIYICENYFDLADYISDLNEEKPLSFTIAKVPSTERNIGDVIDGFLRSENVLSSKKELEL